MSEHISAIDIGSNAIRMILGEVRQNQLQIVKKYRAPVRLGKDVFRDGEISGKTTQAALEAFEKFAEINRRFGVKKCRAVATSAVREADNGKEFAQKILGRSKIPVEIIDGIEEARLIHSAVKREVDLTKNRMLLIDVGGGSVEVTFSDAGKLSATQSFPMGTVRLLEHLSERKLAEKDLKIVMGEFIEPLSNYIESHASNVGLDKAVGTGGNLECMGRLKVQLLHRTPNTYVSLSELVEMTKRLQSVSYKDRVEKLDLRPDRADVIVPAMVLVKTILRQAGVEKILIPCVGLRDGLLWSLMEKPTITPPKSSGAGATSAPR